MSEHITDGKPCWCRPKAIRQDDAIVWVHQDINTKLLLEGQALLEWVIKLDADALESLGDSALKELANAGAEISRLRAALGEREKAFEEISKQSDAMNPWEYACDHAFETKGEACGDCHGCRRANLMLAVVKYRALSAPGGVGEK